MRISDWSSDVCSSDLTRSGTTLFDTDENVRGGITVEKLAGMKPVFRKDGLVTAGNASGLNDGAAALVLAEAGKAAALGLKPLARLVAYSHAGVDPAYMGIGPVPATRLVLTRAGPRGRAAGRERGCQDG